MAISKLWGKGSEGQGNDPHCVGCNMPGVFAKSFWDGEPRCDHCHSRELYELNAAADDAAVDNTRYER